MSAKNSQADAHMNVPLRANKIEPPPAATLYLGQLVIMQLEAGRTDVEMLSIVFVILRPAITVSLRWS